MTEQMERTQEKQNPTKETTIRTRPSASSQNLTLQFNTLYNLTSRILNLKFIEFEFIPHDTISYDII